MPDANPIGGGINWVALMNPELAAKQAKISQQQLLAQQLMQQGSKDDDINKLANPGGFVVPYSPAQGLAKAGDKISGAYLSNKALGDQLAAYKDFAASQNPAPMTTATNGAIQNEGNMGPATAQDVASQYPQKLGVQMQAGAGTAPTMQDMMYGQIAPEWEKAHLALQNAGPIKAAETANTPYVTPQGTYQMGSQIAGNGAPANPASSPALPTSLQQGIANQARPITKPSAPMSNSNAQAMIDTFEPKDTGKGGPVDLPGASDNAPQQAPMAVDGKPLLPNLTNIPAPDPTGSPKFKTENTKTGVEQTIQDQKDAAEGNKAFATTAQSLGQEKSRLDNLIQVYKDVKSGTLTAQNPELFNKLQALGFKDDPASLKDLAGIQNATQNHILQVIQQIKDTNASAGGGAPTRTFGSEITQLLENGESAKGQPEALWNVIGQAKGVVDHHLDMVNGWQKAGGLGNRLAGGYTMRPDDFATQFTTAHNISDYRDKALKEIGPFKGMPGNNGENRISIVDPKGNPGTIDKSHLQSLLSAGGKLSE